MKGDIKAIKIGGKEDKEQEVTVRHETPAQKKAGSVWRAGMKNLQLSGVRLL